MRYYILCLCLLAIACGKKGPDSTAKNIFSSWHMTGCTNGGTEDLTKGNLTSNFPTTYTYKSGEVCTCTARFYNNTYTFTGCSYVLGTGLGSDPGCATHHNDNGSYSIDGSNTLQFYTSVLPASDAVCMIYN